MIPRVTAAAVIVLVCSLALTFAADTTNQQLSAAPGYTFASNVEGYLKVSNDVCDIRAVVDVDTPNWQEASKIYEDGRNSMKSDGSMRTLQGMAGSNEGEPFYDMYAKYWYDNHNSTDFLNAPIIKSLDGGSTNTGIAPYVTVDQRKEQVLKGTAYNIPFVYMMHELDEGYAKLVAGNTDAKTGAPNNVDEVFAIYVGEKPECAFWGQSNSRGEYFGTMFDCETSQVNQKAREAFKRMQVAATSGDKAAYKAGQEELQRLMTIVMYQAIIRYAEYIDNDIKSGNNPQAAQGEGYAFYRTVAPLIHKADPAADLVLFNAFYPGKPVSLGVSDEVKVALASTYANLGISATDIGTSNTKSTTCGSAQSAATHAHAPALASALAGAALAALVLL